MARQQPLPAKITRARRVGTAAQMGYEDAERLERQALKDRLASQKREAAARTASRARQRSREKGMNAGTIGGR